MKKPPVFLVDIDSSACITSADVVSWPPTHACPSQIKVLVPCLSVTVQYTSANAIWRRSNELTSRFLARYRFLGVYYIGGCRFLASYPCRSVTNRRIRPLLWQVGSSSRRKGLNTQLDDHPMKKPPVFSPEFDSPAFNTSTDVVSWPLTHAVLSQIDESDPIFHGLLRAILIINI